MYVTCFEVGQKIKLIKNGVLVWERIGLYSEIIQLHSISANILGASRFPSLSSESIFTGGEVQTSISRIFDD